MIFKRLAIGTANWGKKYNGAKVSEDDQKRILDYCQSSGIDTIHASSAYGWDYSGVNSYFRIITKEEDCLSVYEPSEIPLKIPQDILMVPYSIFDRRFAIAISDHSECEVHVRSIFLRGKLLEKFKPWDCIMFCLMNPNIDRVIIGVDSFEQLKDNLRPFHRMVAVEIHDKSILDPRQWK